MKRSKTKLTARLIETMQRTYLQMQRYSLGEWPDLELTMPQIRTLALLSRGHQRMSDIAGYLGSCLSSATSMIDRLVDKQVVERIHDTSDRRVVTCYLTPIGKEVVERFWQIKRTQIEAVAAVLTLEELETVLHAMEILADAIGRQAEVAPLEPSTASRNEREKVIS